MAKIDWIGAGLAWVPPAVRDLFSRASDVLPKIDWLKFLYMEMENPDRSIPRETLASWIAAVETPLSYLESFAESPANFGAIKDVLYSTFPGIFPNPGTGYHSNKLTNTYAWAAARAAVDGAILTLREMVNYIKGAPVEKVVIEAPSQLPDVGTIISVPVVDTTTGQIFEAEGSITRTYEDAAKPITERDQAIAALNLQERLPQGFALLPKEQGGIDVAKATAGNIPAAVWWVGGGLLALVAARALMGGGK